MSGKRECDKSERNPNVESLSAVIRSSPVNERPIAKSLFGKPSIFGPLSMYEGLVSFFGLRDGSPSDRGAGSS